MTPNNVENYSIQIIEPFILVGKVFGVAKFNFIANRISRASPFTILYSLAVLAVMLYVIKEDFYANVHPRYTYIRQFLGVWSSIQYTMISALTFFLRHERSERMFSKLKRVCCAFNRKFNMAAQRKQNGVAVVVCIGHFVIKTVISAAIHGWWIALLFSHFTLMQSLEEVELWCFFALVRILKCELQRLRNEVEIWYGREAFVVTSEGRSVNTFMEMHGNIMESYNMLIELYSSQFLLSLVTSLVGCLVIVQITIDEFFKGDRSACEFSLRQSLNVPQSCELLYWFMRVLIRLFVVSMACSWLQNEARLFKKALVNILVRGQYETRQEVATLLRVVHSADSSDSVAVYKLFSLDNTLPFKFLSLLATYTIILIQFANM